VGAAVLIAALVYYCLRRPSPAERERRRRLQVHRAGRITDGTVIDFGEHSEPNASDPKRLIYYTYSIGGVEYLTCQDVSSLVERIGDDPAQMFGAVYIKYQSKNPYNSIIVCEEWSGLRTRRRR
jgi:hypothetical protein